MNEDEWLNADTYAQNHFLLSLGSEQQLQRFLCACCRRVDSLLDDQTRGRVSQMAGYYRPAPGVALGDVWVAFRAAVEAAEKCAQGSLTADETKTAAEPALQLFMHFGDIAAAAPAPEEDPAYDDAAVKMGSDAAGAADCAASTIPSAAELCVRVVASCVAYDEDAYYAGAEGDPEFDRTHPHMLARRAERAQQWLLLKQYFPDLP